MDQWRPYARHIIFHRYAALHNSRCTRRDVYTRHTGHNTNDNPDNDCTYNDYAASFDNSYKHAGICPATSYFHIETQAGLHFYSNSFFDRHCHVHINRFGYAFADIHKYCHINCRNYFHCYFHLNSHQYA